MSSQPEDYVSMVPSMVQIFLVYQSKLVKPSTN